MSSASAAQALLSSLVDRYGTDFASQHRWFDEHDRWLELAHALIVQCTAQPDHRVREACAELAQRGLLTPAPGPDDTAGSSEFIIVLERHEVLPADAAKALEVIRKVQALLQQRWSGKLQVYLRERFAELADRMVQDLTITELTTAQTRQAVLFWLQNVVAAPMTLMHPEAVRYCSNQNVSWQGLIAAADDADLHLPLLDDLLHAAALERGDQ